MGAEKKQLEYREINGQHTEEEPFEAHARYDYIFKEIFEKPTKVIATTNLLHQCGKELDISEKSDFQPFFKACGLPIIISNLSIDVKIEDIIVLWCISLQMKTKTLRDSVRTQLKDAARSDEFGGAMTSKADGIPILVEQYLKPLSREVIDMSARELQKALADFQVNSNIRV